MQRRSFLRNTTFSAMALTTPGFIQFDGTRFVGDCATTTDILGPFYRPGSPLRSNLMIVGDGGVPVVLSGTVWHEDCKTTFAKAKIELWHCDAKGVYDNNSSDFRYRGTTYTDDKGRYEFKSVLPVPYDVGNGTIRPAHFHMMISADGYQTLVTQLYFTGDPYIAKDVSANSPAAKSRILQIGDSRDHKKVLFDISLSKKLKAETAALDRLAGVYVHENDPKNKMELFRHADELWVKNEVYGTGFHYLGNNIFEYPSMPPGYYVHLKFDLQTDGGVKLTFDRLDDDNKKLVDVFTKVK